MSRQIDVLDAVSTAGCRSGDGSFEKCAQAAASFVLPMLTGAGLGAGAGLYTNSLRPQDEDEDPEKRKMESLLFGTGAGALGGAGLAAALSMASGGYKPEPSAVGRALRSLDPSWRGLTAILGFGNALAPSDGVHAFRRLFHPSSNTMASGTWAGMQRERLGSVVSRRGAGRVRRMFDRIRDWRRTKALLMGYDVVPKELHPELLFDGPGGRNLSSLIDEMYRAPDASVRANVVGRRSGLLDTIVSALHDRSHPAGTAAQFDSRMRGFIDRLFGTGRRAAGGTSSTATGFYNDMRNLLTRRNAARSASGLPALRFSDLSVGDILSAASPEAKEELLRNAYGKELYGNLRKYEATAAKAGRGSKLLRALRHPVSRGASGLIGLAAAFPSLFGIVSPEAATAKPRKKK